MNLIGQLPVPSTSSAMCTARSKRCMLFSANLVIERMAATQSTVYWYSSATSWTVVQTVRRYSSW